MSVISNIDVGLNATININQGGATDGRAKTAGRFIANVGTLMCRCIPLFILSILGIGPPRGGKS